MQHKTIILKLTGNLIDPTPKGLDTSWIEKIASQIISLKEITFGVVMGGGNFFRGAQDSKTAHIREQAGHLYLIVSSLHFFASRCRQVPMGRIHR